MNRSTANVSDPSRVTKVALSARASRVSDVEPEPGELVTGVFGGLAQAETIAVQASRPSW